MKFSLVLCTVERTLELKRFLASLTTQADANVQLIVVDQNDDDRLVAILAPYVERFAIEHVRSSRRGLSHARNIGLARVRGDIVAFPDDDCWYPANLLTQVTGYLSDSDIDGVTGRFTDADGRSEGRWLRNSAPLDRYNVWRSAISFSIFVRRHVVDRVGGFNESLGVGAGTPWGAAEETDFLLRCLGKGLRLNYRHDLVLLHPVKAGLFDESAQERQRRYEAGIGRVIRMNDYPAWYFPVICARTACGIMIALASGNLRKARFKIAALHGRIRGWRAALAS